MNGTTGIPSDKTSEDSPSSSGTRLFDLFENLIDLTIDGIYLINADSGLLMDVNEAACQALGYSRDELLDMHVWQFSRRINDLAHWRTLLPQFIEQEARSLEDEHIHRDGHLLPVEIKSRFLRHQGQDYFLAIARDIRERQAAEQSRRESDSLLRTTLDSTADGILVVGAQGEVITSNQRFQRIWQIPDTLLQLGDDQKLLSHVLDQLADPGVFIAKVEQLYATEATDFDTLIFKDGRIIERYSEPLKLPTGLGRIWSFRDVTEREQAKAKLEEERGFLRSLIQSIPDLVWLKSPQGEFLTCNARYQEQLDLSEDQIIGKTDKDLFPPDIAAIFQREDQQVMASGEDLRAENRLILPGSEHASWFATVKTPMYRSDGSLIGVLGTARNITEARLNAEKIREIQERRQALFDVSLDGIAIINQHHRIIEANSRLCDMLGYDANEIVTLHTWDYEATMSEADIRTNFADLSQIEARFETQHRRRDGSTFDVEVSVSGRDFRGEHVIIAIVRDISERKLAERQLNDALQRYQTILKSTSDGLCLVNAEGELIEVNQAYCDMSGYTRDELLGMRVSQLDALDHEDAVKQRLQEFVPERQTHFESQHRRRDGSTYHVEVSSSAMSISNKPVFMTIIRDISERIAIREALISANQMHEAVLATANDGFWQVDREGRIEAVNDAYCQQSGYSREEMLQKRVFDLDAWDHLEDAVERSEKIMRHGSGFFETLHLRKNGTTWPVEVSISYSEIQGGKFFCFLRDISERKDKELQLEAYRSSLEQLVEDRTHDIAKQKVAFETLFEKSPNGELIIENGLFVQCNEKVLEMLGYETKEDFLPCPPHALSPLNQPDGLNSLLKAEEMIKLAFAKGAHSFEWIHWRADQSEFWCEVTLTPLSLPGRENLLFVAWRDISEQKAAAESMQRARDMAEAATRLKSEFLANMSHEIRTPMNAIIGMTHLALSSDLDERQHNYIAKAHQAGESLLGILNDILDFSKIEAGKMTLEHRPFELREVMSNLANLMSFKADEKSLQLTLNIDDELPPCLLGDSLRLSQVLINLTSNAIKFTPRKGQVSISATRIETLADAVIVEFRISDTGIGLSAAQQTRLFQPFSQVDSSTTRKFGGTGLGLAISSQLVHKMGGEIAVTSAPEQGSSFWFRLNFDIAQNLSPEPSGHEAQTGDETPFENLRGARILLVEDNEINLELAVELLHMIGVKTEFAINGQQALDMLEQHHFDGVLMDCQMPVMDGYEATRRIRQMAQFNDLPIIAMTANAMKGDREKVLSVGMNDHIAKPLDPELMFSVMANWIKPPFN